MKINCLCFHLAGERYLHNVDSIRAIMPYQPPCPVPGAPPSSPGILDIRGDVISVYSGRSLFGLAEDLDPARAKIVIFDTPSGSFGLLVDGVENILPVDDDRLEHLVDGDHGQMIRGTLEQEGRLLILVDLGDWAATSLASGAA
jgi:purine-binding chemotaxis protein CheW